MGYEEVKKEVEKTLSKKLYNHCLSVAKKAEELAVNYDIDVEKLKTAAIAHDIAKEMSVEETLRYMEENKLYIEGNELEYPQLFHARIGAHICKKKFGFTKQMYKAIEHHTTGSIDMDLMATIIYVADKIEDNRTYEGVEKIREIAKNNIYEAFEAIVMQFMRLKISKEEYIDIKTVEVYNYLIEIKGDNKNGNKTV